MDNKNKKDQKVVVSQDDTSTPEELVNASGHVQELKRQFSLLSLAGIGLTVGNVWPAVGGSVVVALYNGGPPGRYFLLLASTQTQTDHYYRSAI